MLDQFPIKPLPDAAYLRSRYHYCKRTGFLYEKWVWRASLQWLNEIMVGRIIGFPLGRVKSCYRNIRIDGVGYRQHRIVWKMHTGRDPTGLVDHIDGDRGNNRIENLRDVSHTVNMSNRRSSLVRTKFEHRYLRGRDRRFKYEPTGMEPAFQSPPAWPICLAPRPEPQINENEMRRYLRDRSRVRRRRRQSSTSPDTRNGGE